MEWPERAAGDGDALCEGDKDGEEEDAPTCVHIDELEEARGANAPERSWRRSCMTPPPL
ncbi:hypothetical protein PI124_g23108 [Phytophthora idaei]|nr:hypothetical protein PI125_g24728 [Phytophthora idaei]KAG3124884.1 hypothetical protein PI126_g23037 [Phytophthora idaei]KAG3231797.1 hypothetical protein PI124_g23108 [Phytophthora idaei]